MNDLDCRFKKQTIPAERFLVLMLEANLRACTFGKSSGSLKLRLSIPESFRETEIQTTNHKTNFSSALEIQ